MSLIAPLPAPPHEVAASRDLSDLAPRFRERLIEALASLRAAGHDPAVAEAFRTPERQAYLYGFGREYDDGRGIVTNAASAFTSWHGYGLAVDVISASQGWDAPRSFWDALGAAAERAGLTWGGRWKFADLPHVQWGPPMRVSPSPRAAELLREGGGLRAVWREVGAL